MNKKQDFVLGIHPSSRGFGWALFETPRAPFDWGIVEVKSKKQDDVLARFETILGKYRPTTVALEEFNKSFARRSARIRKLCSGIVATAKMHGADAEIVSRADIKKAFPGAAADTREAIAAAIAKDIDALEPRLPEKRRIWESEHPNMAIFSAAACALTHFAQQP